MDSEPAFEDPKAGLWLGLWLSVGALATGAAWWGLARGTARHVHPGMIGVVLTPLALLATAWFAARLLAARRNKA